jgi:tetratricopeptide (TPR) repeat protein
MPSPDVGGAAALSSQGGVATIGRVNQPAAAPAPGGGPRWIRRRLLFWLATFSVPLVVFTCAELAARIAFPAAAADDAYVNLVDVPSFFAVKEIRGRRFYQVTHPEAYRGRRILFPVEKAPGTFRIFVLGESASAGWPHPPSEIFSVYLQQALERAFPERRLEVINVSAHAYAAYRIRLIFENVIHFDPDALVLWTGNNEFLERRSYLRAWPFVTRAIGLANHAALFRWLRARVGPYLFPESSLSAQGREDAMADLTTRLRQEAVELRADPDQLEGVKRHYAASVESMLGDAERAGVPMVLVTVPVNLRDWQPNVSLQPLAGDALARWQADFDAGRAALLRGDADEAVRRLERATEQSPDHAASHFVLARAFEARGERERALASYERACDLDGNPFRAISDFNRALREIAGRHGNATIADAAGAFAAASAPRAPGFDLFLDYVHPTKAGNLVVARVVFDALLGAGLLGPPTGEARFSHVPAPFYQDGSPYDEGRDLRMQTILFSLMGVMHQHEAMLDVGRRLAASGRPTLPVVGQVLEVFPPYLELERRRLLGQPVDAAQARAIEERFQGFYRKQSNAADASAGELGEGDPS